MGKCRCTACRGSRQVMKLGGMMGDCNLCHGKGEINECDVPVPPKVTEVVNSASIVTQVASVVPTVVDSSEIKVPKDVQVSFHDKTVDNKSIKVDGKRAIYKRKSIGK